MAQVSCLLYKRENLNSDSQYPQKRLGMAACICSQYQKSERQTLRTHCPAIRCALDAVRDTVSTRK